jgi:hypothetical protein
MPCVLKPKDFFIGCSICLKKRSRFEKRAMSRRRMGATFFGNRELLLSLEQRQKVAFGLRISM